MKTGKVLSLLAAAVLLPGCASYEKPAEAVKKSSYTSLTKKEQKFLPEGTDFLSLEEAQNIAIANNPDFRSMYYAVAQSRSRYYQSFSSYLPTANFTYSLGQDWSHTYKPYSGPAGTHRSVYSYSTPGISGSWLLFDSFQREMNLLAAKHQWKQSEAAEDDARRILIKNVALSYNSVMQYAANMRIAIADMKFNQDLLKDTQLKFEAGAVPLSDVLNFKIKYNDAESNLVTARFRFEACKYALAALLGLTEGTIPATVKFPQMPTEDSELLADVTYYIDMALANRPDLKQYREALEQSKYSYWSSLCAFGPSFSATYSVDYSNHRTELTYDPGSKTKDDDYTLRYNEWGISYGLQANWNLFAGGSTYFTARAAQAAMAQADFALAQKWIDVVTDVRTAYDNYSQNVKQAKIYQKTYDLTKQTRDLVEEEYKAGSAELTRINEAQRDLVNAETNLVASVVEMANAKAELEAAVNAK